MIGHLSGYRFYGKRNSGLSVVIQIFTEYIEFLPLRLIDFYEFPSNKIKINIPVKRNGRGKKN